MNCSCTTSSAQAGETNKCSTQFSSNKQSRSSIDCHLHISPFDMLTKHSILCCFCIFRFTFGHHHFLPSFCHILLSHSLPLSLCVHCRCPWFIQSQVLWIKSLSHIYIYDSWWCPFYGLKIFFKGSMITDKNDPSPTTIAPIALKIKIY